MWPESREGPARGDAVNGHGRCSSSSARSKQRSGAARDAGHREVRLWRLRGGKRRRVWDDTRMTPTRSMPTADGGAGRTRGKGGGFSRPADSEAPAKYNEGLPELRLVATNRRRRGRLGAGLTRSCWWLAGGEVQWGRRDREVEALGIFSAGARGRRSSGSGWLRFGSRKIGRGDLARWDLDRSRGRRRLVRALRLGWWGDRGEGGWKDQTDPEEEWRWR